MRKESFFREEYDFLKDILPEASWENESNYPPLRGEGLSPFQGLAAGMDVSAPDINKAPPPGFQPFDKTRAWIRLPEGDLLASEKTSAVNGLSKATRNDGSFAEAVWRHLGIDLEEIWADERFAPPKDSAERSRMLAQFTAGLGTEALGMYLPFHAFFASKKTPWGIYLMPEKMMRLARLLHEDGTFLPNPKPSVTFVFRLLWWIAWRHELFHYHVERFATRQEICSLQAIYRPYVENYVPTVRGTADWLEEALAQAVLVDSTMVRKALGIDSHFIETYLKPYLRTFPPGYRDFECKSNESITEAHIMLASSILNTPCVGVTSQFTPLMEYVTSPARVPGHLVFSPGFASRFQLATPTLRETLKYCRRQGYIVDDEAKGDHKRVSIKGSYVQLNKSRNRKETDLASIKDIANREGISTFELMRRIRES